MNDPIVSSDRPITLIGGREPAPKDLTDALTLGADVVCADGGADHALWAELEPCAVIGDLDSLSNTARRTFAPVLHHIPEQETTDFDKALRHIAAPLVLGVGFSGGRLDHELGSLTVLARHPDRRCILIGPETITLLCPPRIDLPLAPDTPVSLYPLAEARCDSHGLNWPTDEVTFAPDSTVGTLNHALGPVSLRPHAAKLLLILPRDALAVTVEALSGQPATWPARAG